jgi:hypothetical protein
MRAAIMFLAALLLLSIACTSADKKTVPCGDGRMVETANLCTTGQSVVCPSSGVRVATADQCSIRCPDGRLVTTADQCTATQQTVLTQVNPPPQPAALPQPQPEPPKTRCDPGADLGGTWEAKGFELKPVGSFRATGHPDYTVHTPKYPSSTPGLPPGVSEDIVAPHATAYCDPYKGDIPQSAAPPSSLPDRNNCTAIRGTDYRSDSERVWFLKNCTGGSSGTTQTSQQTTRSAASTNAPVTTVSAPSCGNPNTDLRAVGAEFKSAGGNKWEAIGSVTIVGHPAWTVHTNLHTGDPGIKIGEQETTVNATAYCKPNAAGTAGTTAPPPPPNPPSIPAPPVVASCPSTAQEIANLVGGNSAYWRMLEPGKWKFGPNAAPAKLTAPSIGNIEWNGPTLQPGEYKDGITEATFNFSC